MVEDNSHAGQGPVMLDIGGDIGAIVIAMPDSLKGLEIEARPIAGPALAANHQHDHHEHEHDHSHGDDGHHHLVHVGVVERPSAEGFSCSAVFSELLAGSYELYVRPDGPTALTVTVVGGEVSSAHWPL